MKKCLISLIILFISFITYSQVDDKYYIEENVKLKYELNKYEVAKRTHILTIDDLEAKLKIHKKALKKTKRKIKKLNNKIYENKLIFDKKFRKEEEENQRIYYENDF